MATSKRTRKKSAYSRRERLAKERGSYLKKWKDKTPAALIYPNSYEVGMSSLGFQLVYSLLAGRDDMVCERFFLEEEAGQPLSVESGRPLCDFSLIFSSISFESDYANLVRILIAAGIEPYSERRMEGPGAPILVGGGVAFFMNPEPLAPFFDFCLLGEAEVMLDRFVSFLLEQNGRCSRRELLLEGAKRFSGIYVPGLYTPRYAEGGGYLGLDHDTALPARVARLSLAHSEQAGHSQVLTPLAEFADLYLTELGRGCSRGCRFCAAGFIYRPPRLWDGDAVARALAECPQETRRVGLLGMEMASETTLNEVSSYLVESGCALSFSSLRADRVSPALLEVLAQSKLKSAAIAPDGASERLRRVINKGLGEEDLIRGARRLVEAGIYRLKLYVMVGLPTEETSDLLEFVELVKKMKGAIDRIGRQRGRLTQIQLSINCFVPKPWTPFQFHPFGTSRRLETGETVSAKEAVASLRERIAAIKKNLRAVPNVTIKAEKPENAYIQAVLARGDRRLAPLIKEVAGGRTTWKRGFQTMESEVEKMILTGHGRGDVFPWYVVDHGINTDYLWDEYEKAFAAAATDSCQPLICRRCGVCGAR